MPEQRWDDLEALVTQLTGEDPVFPAALAAAEQCQRLMENLYAARRERGVSRALVAARMGIGQASLARLERGWVDPRLVTVMQYALALGLRLDLIAPTSAVSQRGGTASAQSTSGER